MYLASLSREETREGRVKGKEREKRKQMEKVCYR